MFHAQQIKEVKQFKENFYNDEKLQFTLQTTRNNSNSVSGESETSEDLKSESSILKPSFKSINEKQRKTKSVHFNFSLLKKKLNLEEFSRKTQIDSLLKKCKSKAFRTIHEALKKCLKIKLQRLPQQFITNIKIDFNKKFLEKTILEIYQECKIITSLDDFVKKNYLKDDKVNIFTQFLSLTFKDVFDYYLNSHQYFKDYNYILKREGEGFAVLFNYISKIFVFYYEKSKGNFKKKEEKIANKIFEIKKITLFDNSLFNNNIKEEVNEIDLM